MRSLKNTARKASWKIAAILLGVFYLTGLAIMKYDPNKPLIIDLIPFALLLNFLVLMLFHKGWSVRFFIASTFIVFSGFFIETLGVHTGWVFGEYSYGNKLGPMLFETPLIIGINWLVVVYSAYFLTHGLKWAVPLKILFGSAILTGYDFFLEPFAIQYNMWSWKGNEVPMSNYLAWFVVSAIFLSLMHFLSLKIKNRISVPLFLIQLFFFIALYFSGY
ncbi:MAG: carotenoid biosynthesis protein [Bacteroidales bacterium]